MLGGPVGGRTSRLVSLTGELIGSRVGATYVSMLLVTLRRALVAVGLLVGRSGDCSESGVMLLRDRRGDVPDRDGVGLVVVAGVDRDATSSSASGDRGGGSGGG